MRIPYVPENPPTHNETEAAILARVKQRRGASGLLPLDRALLHSFPVADGWNTNLGYIRGHLSITDRVRELLICRVAALNEASFEWDHHAPLLVKGGGFPADRLDVLKIRDWDELVAAAADTGCLAPVDLAVLQYADAMTKHVRVENDVFAQLQAHFNPREIVEITVTVGTYNCVSRVLVALNVDDRVDYS